MTENTKNQKNKGFVALFLRISRAINYKPYSRKEIQDLFQENNGAIDPDEQEMLSGVLDVATSNTPDSISCSSGSIAPLFSWNKS